MAKRSFVVRVDEDILRRFDDRAWERRLSRNAAVVELMGSVVPEAAVEASRGEAKRQRVIAELRSGLQRVKTECAHPTPKRLPNYGMWKCEDCGLTWK